MDTTKHTYLGRTTAGVVDEEPLPGDPPPTDRVPRALFPHERSASPLAALRPLRLRPFDSSASPHPPPRLRARGTRATASNRRRPATSSDRRAAGERHLPAAGERRRGAADEGGGLIWWRRRVDLEETSYPPVGAKRVTGDGWKGCADERERADMRGPRPPFAFPAPHAQLAGVPTVSTCCGFYASAAR